MTQPKPTSNTFKEKLERAFEKAWPNMAPTGESAMKWAASFALEEAAKVEDQIAPSGRSSAGARLRAMKESLR